MAREWRPGDVAVIRVSDYPPEVAIRGASVFADLWYVGGPRLGSQHGWRDGQVEVIRPLVVIDPEDREQVKRLLVAVLAHGDPLHPDGRGIAAALREFAKPTPPKPDEPTGLGAVVKDKGGRKWVRAGHSYVDPNWRVAGGDEWTRYADISVSAVLSEGVQP